jgi:hypothetical protein
MTKTENIDIDSSDEAQATDVADRLLSLMQAIRHVADELKYPHPNHQDRVLKATQKNLFEVFGDISERLGFDNYSIFQLSFVSLCNRVVRDIGLINVRNDRTRDRWIAAVEHVRSVFDSDNFGKNCGQVLADHFADEIRDRIEDASERLQTLGRTESTKSELSEALEAARSTLSAFERNQRLPDEVSRVLKHYIQQIEAAYNAYDDFGEDRFWAVYKELFATFVQTHPIIAPDGVSAEIKESLRVMAGKMSFGLRALSVTADIATLATTGAAILALTAT